MERTVAIPVEKMSSVMEIGTNRESVMLVPAEFKIDVDDDDFELIDKVPMVKSDYIVHFKEMLLLQSMFSRLFEEMKNGFISMDTIESLSTCDNVIDVDFLKYLIDFKTKIRQKLSHEGLMNTKYIDNEVYVYSWNWCKGFWMGRYSIDKVITHPEVQFGVLNNFDGKKFRVLRNNVILMESMTNLKYEIDYLVKKSEIKIGIIISLFLGSLFVLISFVKL